MTTPRTLPIPVSGKTLLFPVIGHPARQVRAPAVFNALFAEAGMDALCIGLDVAPEAVLATCRALLQSPSVGGLLVTVPFKKTLAQAADRLGVAAAEVGAVNALRRTPDGGIEGDLFDGLGFVRGLQAAGQVVAGSRVLLLGAGGAGSAIAAALAGSCVRELAIYDPHHSSVADIARRLARHHPGVAVRQLAHPLPAAFDIVVNASPMGLRPDDPLPLDPGLIAAGTLVCDVIMEPATTRFLEVAMARGLPVHRGAVMLDHQLPAYLSFFGLESLAAHAKARLDGGRPRLLTRLKQP